MESRLAIDLQELVAIGAAVGANCEPCLRYHIGKARDAGLTDDQLRAAIATARRVKEIPARSILEAAEGLLGPGERQASERAKAGCCQG